MSGQRHFMARTYDYSLDDAIENGWIVRAMCGELFEPSVERRNSSLPICQPCQTAQYRPESLRPHYVYRCYDSAGRLVYVGCTFSPPSRLESHRIGSWWWPQVSFVRNLVFPSRDAALARERSAIFNEMPRANVRGRWFKRDSRENWGPEDYVEFRHAIVQSVESTHGVYGVGTNQLLKDVDAELAQRFGVTHLDGRRGA